MITLQRVDNLIRHSFCKLVTFVYVTYANDICCLGYGFGKIQFESAVVCDLD